MWAIAGRVSTGILAAVAIYLVTLLLSVGCSAAYNVWPESATKRFLRRFDHSAIFLLIAGTYTPFMVQTGMGWLLAAVWLIAVGGVGVKLWKPGQFDRLSIALYLGLGWVGVLAYQTLFRTLPVSVVWLIIAGGIVYSLGVIFHSWRRLQFQNAIWHAFVLVAAGIHFLAVWRSAVSLA